MDIKIIDKFKEVEEIKIELPNSRKSDWQTDIICKNSLGLRVKLVLISVESYANIWALTHEFDEMDLIDHFDGTTKYEYGRFQLRIKNGDNIDEQWFKVARIEKI